MADTLAPAPQRKNVIFGAILMTIVVAILVVILLQIIAKPHMASVVVFVPGDPNLDTQTDVQYHSDDVGKVSEVQHSVVAMRLSVSAPGETQPVLGAATLSASRPHLRIDMAQLDLYYSLHEVVLVRGSVADTLDRVATDTWQTRGNAPPKNFSISPQKDSGGSLSYVITTGAVIFCNPVSITWNDEMPCMMLTLSMDTAQFRKSSGVPIQPGSQVSVQTNLGLSRPSLSFQPAYSEVQLVKGSIPMEVLSLAGLDLQALLQDITSYALSPSANTAPPKTRYQRIIAGLNEALDNANGALRHINTLSDIDSGNGLVGRLIFSSRDQRNVDGIIANADSLIKALNGDGAVGKMLLSRAQQDSLNAILHTAKHLVKSLDTTGGIGNAVLSTSQQDSVAAILASTNALIKNLSADGGLQKLALSPPEQDSVKAIINSIHTVTDGLNEKIAGQITSIKDKVTAFGIISLIMQLVSVVGTVWIATKIH